MVQKNVELSDSKVGFLFAEFLRNLKHTKREVTDGESSLVEVRVFVMVESVKVGFL